MLKPGQLIRIYPSQMVHFLRIMWVIKSNLGKWMIQFAFLKNGNHIALEGDSEHLSTSDCRSSNIIQCYLFSEGTFAGDYVLKK